MYTNVEEFTQCQRKCTQVEVLNHPIPHLEFISHIEFADVSQEHGFLPMCVCYVLPNM